MIIVLENSKRLIKTPNFIQANFLMKESIKRGRTFCPLIIFHYLLLLFRFACCSLIWYSLLVILSLLLVIFYSLLAIYCSLLVTFCSLLVTCYFILVARYFMFFASYFALTGCYFSLVACYFLLVICYFLRNARYLSLMAHSWFSHKFHLSE